MGSKVLVGGTGYEAKGGKVLVGGTGYSIKQGKTLVSGTGRSISFGRPASELSVGESVFLTVNGVLTEFLVVHKGNPDSGIYDTSCDGIWITAKYAPDVAIVYTTKDTSGILADKSYDGYYYKIMYHESTPHNYLNSTYYNTINTKQREHIKAVKVPYSTDVEYDTTYHTKADGVAANIFLLCSQEMNPNPAIHSGIGVVLQYFSSFNMAFDSRRAITTTSGSKVDYWTRDSVRGYDDGRYKRVIGYVSASGGEAGLTWQDKWETEKKYLRPTMILSYDTKVNTQNVVI